MKLEGQLDDQEVLLVGLLCVSQKSIPLKVHYPLRNQRVMNRYEVQISRGAHTSGTSEQLTC